MKKGKKGGASGPRAEYDFSGGIRGKHSGRVRNGRRVVILEPAVAELFPDSRAVNRALKALAEIVRRAAKKTSE